MTDTAVAERFIEPLGEHHSREAFSCDHPEISAYFQKQVLADHQAYKVRAKVCTLEPDGPPIGFYSLVIGALATDERPKMFKRKFGNKRPIPSVYLAAVAVDSEHCRQGIGSLLMLDAFEATARIAENAGVACMSLDAVDEEKARWYESLQFQRIGILPDGKIQMFIPLGTLKDALV